VELIASARGPSIRPDQVGFYEISVAGETWPLAVNFHEPEVSRRVVRGAPDLEEPKERAGEALPASIQALLEPEKAKPARRLFSLLLAAAALLGAALWVGHGAGLVR
jgi:hypothetical protein